MSNNNHLYEDPDARTDTVLGRNQYWSMLRKLRNEYDLLVSTNDTTLDFDDYVRLNYGLKIGYENGFITANQNIVDEKLFLIALIKFGDGKLN